jgi:hypothetical protein
MACILISLNRVPTARRKLCYPYQAPSMNCGKGCPCRWVSSPSGCKTSSRLLLAGSLCSPRTSREFLAAMGRQGPPLHVLQSLVLRCVLATFFAKRLHGIRPALIDNSEINPVPRALPVCGAIWNRGIRAVLCVVQPARWSRLGDRNIAGYPSHRSDAPRSFV